MSEIQQTPTSPLMKLRQKIFPQSEIKVIRKDLEKVFDRLLSLSLSFFLSDLELPITFNFLLSLQALWRYLWAAQYHGSIGVQFNIVWTFWWYTAYCSFNIFLPWWWAVKLLRLLFCSKQKKEHPWPIQFPKYFSKGSVQGQIKVQTLKHMRPLFLRRPEAVSLRFYHSTKNHMLHPPGIN